MTGRHRIVLHAVEIVPRDVNHLHLLISDLHAFGVEVGIDLAACVEVGLGGRGADELDDDLVTDPRLAAPVSW